MILTLSKILYYYQMFQIFKYIDKLLVEDKEMVHIICLNKKINL